MKQKNVVMIMADQFRKDGIGAYGNAYIQTPNLNKLAAKSVQFNRCYVANPICSPNRMSLFTGCMPSNHGLWTNGILGRNPDRTVSSKLRKAGYQTASIGKIHFNPYSVESAGFSYESEANWKRIPESMESAADYFGFEHVELTIGHTAGKAHYYKWFKENGGTDDMFDVELTGPAYGGGEICGIRKMPASLSSTSFVGERSVNYLKNVRDKSKPFFLSVSFPDPHHPFTSCYDDYENRKNRAVKPAVGTGKDLETRPEHYKRHFNGGWTRYGEIPCRYQGGVPKDIALERIRHTYAMIEAIDRNVGMVLDTLKTENLMEDTIIIFVTDHGELLNDHGLWTKGPFFYEGLINTPLLIYYPGCRHQICEQLVSSIDLTPTLYDMLGVEIPSFVDGISQKKTLADPSVSTRECCTIQYRNGYHCDQNVNVLVTADSKLVAYENGDREYTDLAGDPAETTNYANAAGRQEQVYALERKLLTECLKNKSKGAAQYGHA